VSHPNLALRARQLRGWRRWLLIGALLLASVCVGIFSVLQPSPGTSVALWWPAAGLNVIAALVVTGRRQLLVLALIAASSVPATLISDRQPSVIVIGALAVAVEAAIVARFSTRGSGKPRLRTRSNVVRFFLGTILAASLTGVVTGGTLSLSDGENFGALALAIAASHASAIAVIVPIVLVNRLGERAGRIRAHAGHSLLLLVAVFVSFAPGSVAPLTFLPVPFLAWSAFSFSMSFALIQLIGSSALVVALTAQGAGPFAAAADFWLGTSALVQVYILTLAITTLFISATRNERERLEEQKDATAQLLHDGFEQAQNGFALMQEERGVFRMIDVNASAKALLESSFNAAGELSVDSRLRRLFQTLAESKSTTMTEQWDDDISIPAIVTVSRVTNSTFGEIMLVAVVDLRPVRAAEERMQFQIDREQAVVEELRGLNQQKDDFISSVTHELRTPITTVMGFAEELGDTALDETQRDYLTIIHRNADRLLSVVEDVLLFSKDTSVADAWITGELRVEAEEQLDLGQIMSSTVEDLSHFARDRGITVTVAVSGGTPTVRAVANDLTRVLINLATNAIKFTAEGGVISVIVTTLDSVVELTITDNGIGIDPDDLAKVFDRFYRSPSTTQAGIPGTGLGLAIVRDLVTRMHGTIVLESDGENGTTARLRLPVAAPALR